jgi:O-antigen/teichoic acid export membrane protein
MAGTPEAPEQEHHTTRPSFRVGMGFAASSFVFNALLSVFSAIVTARVYGVETIGEYALVIAPWLMLVQFSNLSEQVALVRDLADLPARSSRVTGLFVPVLGFSATWTSAVAVAILAIAAAVLRGPVDQPELLVPSIVLVVGYILFENTSWNFDSVLSAFRAGRELFWCRLTQVGSFLVLALTFAQINRSLWALVVATVCSFALGLILRVTLVGPYMSFRLRGGHVREGVRRLPHMLRFASRLVPGTIALGLVSQAQVWILGSIAPVATVGAYSRASGMAVRINEAGFRVSEILFPTLVARHNAGDDEGFERTYLTTLRTTTLALFLAAAAGGGAAHGVMRIFGPGFDEASDALALLLLAYSLAVTSMLEGQALLAVGRPLSISVTTIIRSLLSVGLMIPAAMMYGATGMAAVFAAGLGGEVAVRAWMLRHQVLGSSGDRSGARTALAIVLAFPAGFAVARTVDLALVWPLGLLGGAAAGGLTYGVVAVAAGAVSAEERRMLVTAIRDRIERRSRRT